jgi:cytochrome b5
MTLKTSKHSPISNGKLTIKKLNRKETKSITKILSKNSKSKNSKFKNSKENINKVKHTNKYDIIVVGGGISGINTAYYLQKKHPKLNILVLEASNNLGGRLQTIQHHGTHYEAGGARFNNKQTRIIKLLKHLELFDKKIPISSDTYFKPYPKNKFQNVPFMNKLVNNKDIINLDPLFNELSLLKQTGKISHQELINHSILDLVDKKLDYKYNNIKKILEQIYEYWSEIAIMNSNDALLLFKNDFNKKMQYYMLKSGLSSIIKLLSNYFRELGGKIKTSSYLDTIKFSNDKHILNVLENYQKQVKYQCNHLVLAIQQKDLLKLEHLTKNIHVTKMLKSVSPQPLYRIYAKYPVKNGKSWFHNMPKIATNLHLKFIIPYDYDKGLIMITYTDGKYAKYWNQKLLEGEKIFMKQLNLELSQLFPEKEIPDPLWIQHHYWNSGAAYWKTGVESHKIIPKMISPYGEEENIYICGENFSNHQAWMEGALQTSELVIDELSNRLKKTKKKTIKTIQGGGSSGDISGGGNSKTKNNKNTNTKKTKHQKKSKKVKKYSLKEVEKHNKKTDAWLIINKKVYDVTKWIDKHPGGLIIMKGVGKDATTLFKNIGHSQDAKNILKQFFIGYLKK